MNIRSCRVVALWLSLIATFTVPGVRADDGHQPAPPRFDQAAVHEILHGHLISAMSTLDDLGKLDPASPDIQKDFRFFRLLAKLEGHMASVQSTCAKTFGAMENRPAPLRSYFRRIFGPAGLGAKIDLLMEADEPTRADVQQLFVNVPQLHAAFLDLSDWLRENTPGH